MTASRPAAGGGRWIEVAPERLQRWLEGFAERHGATTAEPAESEVTVRAADGAVATVFVPFPPMPVDPADTYGGVLRHAARPRAIGLFLVRRGGFAAGIVRDGKLAESKVGSRHVQGRTAAGGWSQQRFARRREGQTRESLGAAADVAFRILVPQVHDLDAIVTGGDRAMVSAALADNRLAALRPLVAERFLPVADPRRSVLEAAVASAYSVRIHLVESGP